MKSKIKKWYAAGLWTATMVRNAVVKEVITAEDYEEITGDPYETVTLQNLGVNISKQY